jgi:Rieske 2Fe-2S family protein
MVGAMVESTVSVPAAPVPAGVPAAVPAAPLPAAGIEAALAPFGASRMLPADAYLSEAVLAWERRHLFAGAWTCLGRSRELFPPGTNQRTVTAGDVGVLLLWARESDAREGDAPGSDAGGGRVRAFANVCRHRGHELLPAGGTAGRNAVACPYHGWTYRLDGALATAAGMRDVAGFDPAGHGLIELPLAEWHGWLFVNAWGGAPAFDAYLGALDGLIAPYRPEELRLGARHTYDVAANWKVIVENYHECYHCPLIHPELCRVSPASSGQNWDLPGVWVGGAMDLREHAETMSLSGRSAGRFIEGAPRGTVRYVGLFPHLLISAHPDYVMTHLLTPRGPGMTTVECSWYVPDGVAEPTYATEFWDITNREDWAACESVQRGLASPHYRPGPLATGEDAVYQWVNLIARAYQDPAGALLAACGGPV